MDHFAYLVAAYSIIFALIFLYVLFMRTRQRRLEAELSRLTLKIDRLQNEFAARSDKLPDSASS